MTMKNTILVLGYNNTRINDVKKMRETALRHLGALTILCKKDPTEEDKGVADYVIDVGLEPMDSHANIVLDYCKALSLHVLALLPFSDPGTQLGSILSRKMGLRGPNSHQAVAALDKFAFREAEKNALLIPPGYLPIHSEKIQSFEHLSMLCEKMGYAIFLKPAKEGNSRGCIDLQQEKDLKKAWVEVEKYKTAGVVAEELVQNAEEYSWDHVAGFSWVTEKKTTHNQYRAEIQQIVPAPLTQQATDLIHSAGHFMAEISGSNGGASHNEVFYIKNSNIVRGVEPNLRPAGMRIWDLAALTFEQFDPWKEWILWAAGHGDDHTPKNFKHTHFAGIRMVSAPKSGTISGIQALDLKALSSSKVELLELVWTKKIGEKVNASAKDNADYVAYLIARSKNYDDLAVFLEHTAASLEAKVDVDDLPH